MPSIRSGILRRITKFLTLGALLFPFTYKGSPLPPAAASQLVPSEEEPEQSEQAGPTKIIDFKHIFTDERNREYVDYIVNNTENQRDLGIHPDGKRNFYVKPTATNQIISETFNSSEMQLIAHLFASPNPSDFPILIGEDIDRYLETIRKGSWGTTVMSVDRQGSIHFDSISLRQFLVDPDYQGDAASLRSLVLEEFFQAHQYDEVAGALYNSGYLAKTAHLASPESVMKAISTGNLRAFLELIQQKHLFDLKAGRNSYDFYVGNTLFPDKAVNAPFDKLQRLVSEFETTGTLDLLSHEDVRQLNDAFREKYRDHYIAKGFTDSQVHIWNLVGMKRENRSRPENSLDMPAMLPLPSELNGE